MIEQTLEKMKKMKLYGMQHSFRLATETDPLSSLTPDKPIVLLVDSEWDDRPGLRQRHQEKRKGFKPQAKGFSVLKQRACLNFKANEKDEDYSSSLIITYWKTSPTRPLLI